MVNSSSASQSLCEHFARQAVLPKQAFEKAKEFLLQLEASGGEMTASDRKKGGQLLKSLEDQTLGYEFAVAQQIVWSAKSSADIDKKVEEVGKNFEEIEITAKTLRQRLGSAR
jgi:hypothetical protein